MNAMTRVSCSAPPLSRYDDSTGDSVSDRNSEIASAIEIVKASGANILPSMPDSVISGRNTRMMMPTPTITGVATSCTALTSTCVRVSPVFSAWPSRSNAFSTTTTEPSTIRPMAMASPPSDIRLADSPTWFITMNVSNGVSTSVASTITEERTSPRNRNSTITTSTTPSSSTLVTVHSAESTSSLRS